MRKFVLPVLVGVGLLMTAALAQADFGSACSSCNSTASGWCSPLGGAGAGGYAPKWAFWSRSNKCGYYCSAEEERWQRFWHDYYKALHHFYRNLDKCDWVIYYKYHGYRIDGGGQACQPCSPSYAPVYVSPTIYWSMPGQAAACGNAPVRTGGWGNCNTCR